MMLEYIDEGKKTQQKSRKTVTQSFEVDNEICQERQNGEKGDSNETMSVSEI